VVHGSNMSDHDKELVKQSGATVAHCLSSNMTVGDGTSDICELAGKWNIPICIATDGYVTSGTMDVLEEARRCYRYLRTQSGEYKRLYSQDVLDMITCNAAKALGLEDIVGSIEQGKRADLVLFKKVGNGQDPVDNLISGKMSEIVGVVVAGTLVVHNNKLTHEDEQKIATDYADAIAAVQNDISTR